MPLKADMLSVGTHVCYSAKSRHWPKQHPLEVGKQSIASASRCGSIGFEGRPRILGIHSDGRLYV